MLSDEQVRQLVPTLMTKTAGFDASLVRKQLCRRGFLQQNVIRYCYRPFGLRWLYWEPETKLLDRNRSEYFRHVRESNIWLSAGQRNRKEDFYQPQFTRCLADHHLVEFNVGMFPLSLYPDTQAAPLLKRNGDEARANLRRCTTTRVSSASPTPVRRRVLGEVNAGLLGRLGRKRAA